MPVAMITGASRGLGKALAEDLARDGWDLVIDARDNVALAQKAAAVAAAGPRARIRALPGDVADPAHRTELVTAATELGGLDLLVNNASLLGPSPQPTLDAYPLDVLETVYRVNVVAPLGSWAGSICWSTTPASSGPRRNRGSTPTRSTCSRRCTG